MATKQADPLYFWTDKLSRLAEQALLTEAVLSPKPGLVDAIDSGAHSDMDIHTFIQSATSFRDSFSELVMLGLTYSGPLDGVLPRIRQIGIEAEKEMFTKTEGVNTHKGVVFSIGILLTAYGLYLQKNDIMADFSVDDTAQVIEIVKALTTGIVERELSNLDTKPFLTNGEKLYMKYGITGVRGEIEQGLPSVTQTVMPYLRNTQGENVTKRLLDSLFLLMKTTEDSNIIHRSNIETLQRVKQLADDFLKRGGMEQEDALVQVANLNEVFIEWNISPGGSADLLSVAIFMGRLEGILK